MLTTICSGICKTLCEVDRCDFLKIVIYGLSLVPHVNKSHFNQRLDVTTMWSLSSMSPLPIRDSELFYHLLTYFICLQDAEN